MKRPGPSGVTTVALIDDVPLLHAGLASLFTDSSSSVRVVESLPAFGVDVALFDMACTARNPHDRLGRLIADPRVRSVVGFSWSADPVLVESALIQGAAGYLSKRASADDLAADLRRIHAGELVIARELDGPRDVARLPRLTPRELDMILSIARGRTNAEIAQELHLSINSVKSYVRNAYRKLGITRRSQAVAWAASQGYSLHAAQG